MIVFLWCDFTNLRNSFNGLFIYYVFIYCVFIMWFHKNADFILWFIHFLCIYVVISQKCGIRLMVYSLIVYLRCVFMIVFLWLCFYDVISQKCGIHFMVIYNCIFMIVFLWLCFYDVVFTLWSHKNAEFISWFIH
jgi:hypothetical protein